MTGIFSALGLTKCALLGLKLIDVAVALLLIEVIYLARESLTYYIEHQKSILANTISRVLPRF